MKPRRIAIFLPRDNDFYRALLPQMCRGFEACGVEASGVLRLLAPAELADYCASTRTEVVLEMNRARADVAGLPREVLHLSWVVDLGGRAVDDFVGSDVTYLFSDAWLQHFTRGTPMRWLPPGTCTHDYPARPHRGGFALGFLGHIPNPWSAAELARDVTGGAGACDFGTLLPAIERLLRTAGDESLSVDGVLDRIDAVCRDRSGHPLVLDPTLAYDITCRVIRHLNRTELTDGALAMHAQLSSQPWAARWRERWLAIWGTPNWSRWPAYAPHYRGWLDRPAAMGEAYADVAVVLHEGTGMHFRSVDAMATGAVVAFRELDHETRKDGLHTVMHAGEHFVAFPLRDMQAALGELLSDRVRAQAIRDAAAAEVRARHGWQHRAAQILEDVAAL
ncbi:MAG: glycosyltransferase [Nannocystaceae bacterium]|nr:glycosyltransferase [Nannocystaceae bacterium]